MGEPGVGGSKPSKKDVSAVKKISRKNKEQFHLNFGRLS